MSASIWAPGNTLTDFTTTVSSATTITLTLDSTRIQQVTGSIAQTILLPVVSTLVSGREFEIINDSSAAVTVQSSGGNEVVQIAADTRITTTYNSVAGTTAASWSATSSGGTGQMLGDAAAKAMFWNAQTIGENITVGTIQNALSVGPITVSSGYTITINSGGRWVIL